jgi:Arc/MetJ family transcription regulator
MRAVVHWKLRADILDMAVPKRTNVRVDDELLKQATRASGAATKREAVDKALRLIVALKAQESIRQLRGKLKWDGDLDTMRRDVEHS